MFLKIKSEASDILISLAFCFDSININRTLFKLIYKKFYEKILWNSVYYSIIFNSWIIKNNIL